MDHLVIEKDSDVFLTILNKALSFPGVRVNRNHFLKSTLSKYFDEKVVDMAIKYNPAKAGIPREKLEVIAKSSINYETKKVTIFSAAAGVPGKFGMVATIPADLTQYFAHILIILQKLIYLYGWQDIFSDDGIDDETLNLMTIFIGVMFGVQAANVLIQKIAVQAAVRANKVIAAKPLMKGVVYPIVKRIVIILGGKINKRIFASSVSKMVPVLGAATSGTLTYATFKPLAIRLKKHLELLPTADVHYYKSEIGLSDEDLIIDVSDIDESNHEV